MFKRKITQEGLAISVMEFIRRARFSETVYKILPEGTSINIINKFIRAEFYLVIYSSLIYFPNAQNLLSLLLELLYDYYFKNQFDEYDKFVKYFKGDYMKFFEMINFGEKTGNGMLYGVSKWIYDEKEGTDLLGQLKIVPFLFEIYKSISELNKKYSARTKIIN
jgi:hypothetical protein